MIKNYIKVAWRNLLRNKATSAINIFGLALGMSCCFIILMYVTDEKSYDRWLPDSERVYRTSMDIINNDGKHILFAPTAAPLAGALKDYPQVEQAIRINSPFDEYVPIKVGDNKIFYEEGFFWADPNVFEVFQFDFLAGIPSKALEAPRNIVLTRTMAEKYFSIKKDFSQVLNQTIKKDTTEYLITGVIENIPHNTSFKPQFIASLKEFEGRNVMQNWHATMFHNFIKLKAGTDVAAFEKQVKNIADNYVADEIKSNAQSYNYFLQPLTSIHLHSNLRFELSKNNSYRYIQIFGLVAIFILLLACINFINLITAHAAKRAKEIGVRKVTGAHYSQLVGQFMTETLLTSFIAAVIAIGFVVIVLPSFNMIADKAFSLTNLMSSQFAFLLVGIIGTTGILAGTYPAFALSKLKPAEIIRSKFLGKEKGSSRLRSGLVVTQFSISIALIIGTVVLSQQVQFLKKQNLGFDKEHLIVVHAPRSPELSQNFTSIRNELGKLSGVQNVCVTGIIPGKKYGNNLIFLKGDKTKSTGMQLMQIDEKFLETYKIPVLAGRNLSEKIPEDLSTNVFINEATLPFFGWSNPEEAIGKTFDGGWGTIAGVVKNFHYNSLHKEVSPLIMYFNQNRFSYVTLNVATPNVDEFLPTLKSAWTEVLPSTPFQFSFLDETFDRQYRFEDRLTSLFKVFGVLAILIACLGLFGLAAFMAKQRTKEIGIRKVLGATTISIIGLLSKDFLKLVVIALLLASPLAYFFMGRWLEGFSYRIEIQWWIFALTGLAALGIAFLTVSFQSLKAALHNPVDSLKNE